MKNNTPTLQTFSMPLETLEYTPRQQAMARLDARWRTRATDALKRTVCMMDTRTLDDLLPVIERLANKEPGITDYRATTPAQHMIAHAMQAVTEYDFISAHYFIAATHAALTGADPKVAGLTAFHTELLLCDKDVKEVINNV